MKALNFSMYSIVLRRRVQIRQAECQNQTHFTQNIEEHGVERELTKSSSISAVLAWNQLLKFDIYNFSYFHFILCLSQSLTMFIYL